MLTLLCFRLCKGWELCARRGAKRGVVTRRVCSQAPFLDAGEGKIHWWNVAQTPECNFKLPHLWDGWNQVPNFTTMMSVRIRDSTPSGLWVQVVKMRTHLAHGCRTFISPSVSREPKALSHLFAIPAPFRRTKQNDRQDMRGHRTAGSCVTPRCWSAAVSAQTTQSPGLDLKSSSRL